MSSNIDPEIEQQAMYLITLGEAQEKAELELSLGRAELLRRFATIAQDHAPAAALDALSEISVIEAHIGQAPTEALREKLRLEWARFKAEDERDDTDPDVLR